MPELKYETDEERALEKEGRARKKHREKSKKQLLEFSKVFVTR
jgi:hypothetical protein